MFRNVRLDPAISFGATGGGEFDTDVPGSGEGRHESRNANRIEELGQWDVSYAARLGPAAEKLKAFFRVIGHGQEHTWRFKDWSDFKCTIDQGVLREIDSTHFQLYKRETVEGFTYDYKIWLPVADTLSHNGSGECTVDETTGILTVVSGSTPTACAFEYDKPARFGTDAMRLNTIDRSGDELVFGWQAIPVVEVIDRGVLEVLAPPETDLYHDAFTGSADDFTGRSPDDVGGAYTAASGSLANVSVDGSGAVPLYNSGGADQVQSALTAPPSANYTFAALFLIPAVPTHNQRYELYAHDETNGLNTIRITVRVFVGFGAGVDINFTLKDTTLSTIFSTGTTSFSPSGASQEAKLVITDSGVTAYLDGVSLGSDPAVSDSVPTHVQFNLNGSSEAKLLDLRLTDNS